MFGITDYWAFVAAVLVFLMLPGPGTFAVLTATARGGLRGGYASLAGLMVADWLLMAAALVGIAALLAAHPLLFATVQWLGAGYLVWVGVQLLRPGGASAAAPVPVYAPTFFRQGFFITLINPKAIVFYMAFFPLFVDPAGYRGAVTLAALAGTISALTLAYGSLLIVSGHWVARRLRANRVIGRWLARVAGTALIGFGVRLAAE